MTVGLCPWLGCDSGGMSVTVGVCLRQSGYIRDSRSMSVTAGVCL